MEKVLLGGLLASVKIIRICKTRAYKLSCFPVFCFTALLRKICRTISLKNAKSVNSSSLSKDNVCIGKARNQTVL